jgi:hypothetical protein
VSLEPVHVVLPRLQGFTVHDKYINVTVKLCLCKYTTFKCLVELSN